MDKKLYDAYTNIEESLFDDDYTKIKAHKAFEAEIAKHTRDEIMEELVNVKCYYDYLRKQCFYTFDYDEEDEDITSPLNLYKRWLEKDLLLYTALAQCSDEHLKEVIRFFVARDYSSEAIMTVANYINMRKKFSSEKWDEDIF